MKKLLLVGLLTCVSACSKDKPATPPPPIDPYPAYHAQVQKDCGTIWQQNLQRSPSDAELLDCWTQIEAKQATNESWSAHLQTTDEYANLHIPPLQAIRRDGRYLVRADGSPFVWNGLTDFRLLEFLATGREAEADANLTWAQQHDVTVVRVLSMAWNLFRLDPATGRQFLPRLLDLARSHGLYVEIVALADTKSFASMDMGAHIEAIGAMCAASVACIGLEQGNELASVHETQLNTLGDVNLLRQFRQRIPSSVLVSLGSTHGPDDESDIFKDGDYLTIHGDRTSGENGWRVVRHTNEQRALAERVNRFAVNDEPWKDDLSPDKHLGMALLCRMFGLGDTFHYQGGVQSILPTGAEVAAFEARRSGWAMIPADWRGTYMNAGFAGSPVKSFTGADRVYSSINGSVGYTLALGADGERIDWNWGTRDLLVNEGGVRLWRVQP